MQMQILLIKPATQFYCLQAMNKLIGPWEIYAIVISNQ